MKNYLIVGASGSVGSEVGKALANQGEEVRAITSKPERAGRTEHGMRWTFADLRTGEGVAEAFQGIDRAFIFSPPGHIPQHRTISPLIQEALRCGAEKLVLMTALGIELSERSSLRQAELELERSGLAYNIVRPNWFMQNFNGNWLPGIRKTGKISLPVGTAKASFIDARDVSSVIARLISTDDLNNRAFTVTGAEALSISEAAGIISTISGFDVAYNDISKDDYRAALLAAGIPVAYADFLLHILDFLALGQCDSVTNAVSELLGRPPISFEQYVADYKQAWAQ